MRQTHRVGVRIMWVNRVREEPKVYDGFASAIEQYLRIWRAMKRENAQHALRKANPMLPGLIE